MEDRLNDEKQEWVIVEPGRVILKSSERKSEHAAKIPAKSDWSNTQPIKNVSPEAINFEQVKFRNFYQNLFFSLTINKEEGSNTDSERGSSALQNPPKSFSRALLMIADGAKDSNGTAWGYNFAHYCDIHW